jgi:hypothetical protein
MRTKKILLGFVLLAMLMMLILPVLLAGSQHEESGEFEHRVSTEGLSGLSLFLVNLYNDQRMVYALVTTAAMALFGGLIALTVDFFLIRLGLTVSKMEHKE